MENIKITIKIICLAALGMGLINGLVKDKKQAKTINFVTGLIFLILVLSPIINGKFDFDFSKLDNIKITTSEAEINLNSKILSETEKRLEEMLKNELTERGIAVKRLKVKCVSDENGSITISEIICELLDSEKIEFVKGILSERTGNSECLTVY